MKWLRRLTVVTVLGSAVAEILTLIGLRQRGARRGDPTDRADRRAADRQRGDPMPQGRRQPYPRRWPPSGGRRRVAPLACRHVALFRAGRDRRCLAGRGRRHQRPVRHAALPPGDHRASSSARACRRSSRSASLARTLPHGAEDDARFGGHAARYYRVIRIAVISVIIAIAAVLLLQLWGFDALAWFRPVRSASTCVSALLTVAFADGLCDRRVGKRQRHARPPGQPAARHRAASVRYGCAR